MWRMDRLRRSFSLVAGPRRRRDHGHQERPEEDGHQQDRPEGMAGAVPSRLRRSSSRPAAPDRSNAGNRESTASDEAIASFLAEFERQRAERLLRTGTEQQRQVAETLLRATGTSTSELQSTENDAAIAALIAGSTEDSTAFSGEATVRHQRLEQQPQQQQRQPSPTLAPSGGDNGAGNSSVTPSLGPEATAAVASRAEALPRRIVRVAAQQAFSSVVATPPTAAADPAANAPAAVDLCADDAAIAAALAEAVDDQAFRPTSQPTSRSQPNSNPTVRQETCITCLDQVADACFIPCGHINVCCRCAARVNPRKCPVCRMNFEHFVRTQRR